MATTNHRPLYIASDHAGYALKSYLIENNPSLQWRDLGPPSEERVDYPDFADKVAHEVAEGHGRGVLICGSGQGMAMRANRYMTVRAALCWDLDSARLSRQHNDANLLCLGGRLINPSLAQEILRVFLHEPFEGGRHQARIDKLSSPLGNLQTPSETKE